jgi:hypothetical protein
MAVRALLLAITPTVSIFRAVILVRPEFLPFVPSERFCSFAYSAS